MTYSKTDLENGLQLGGGKAYALPGGSSDLPDIIRASVDLGKQIIVVCSGMSGEELMKLIRCIDSKGSSA